ncbi:unnamed protein product [Kuraishia capsulata CBS 1993]|uniref:Protein BIG1 n=1 Tax=Kuraishia capsulata CBS 1993 TaxID=1382522 RepID=W6MXW4_9ASCO|nr:uncharacterized protein KUCA_T00005583001 [Kuraishia capsulata CBS 1993]CDK29590.1 unnamed protein product [Kuraishia capsulata CBS 1993]
MRLLISVALTLSMLLQAVSGAPAVNDAKQRPLIPDSTALETLTSTHLKEGSDSEDLVVYKDDHGFIYAKFDLVHLMKIYGGEADDVEIGEMVLMSTQYFNLTQGAIDLERDSEKRRVKASDVESGFKRQRAKFVSIEVSPEQSFVRSAYSSRMSNEQPRGAASARSAEKPTSLDDGHDHGFRHDPQDSYATLVHARYGKCRGVHKLVLKGEIINLESKEVVTQFKATGNIPVDPLDYRAHRTTLESFKSFGRDCFEKLHRLGSLFDEDTILGFAVLSFVICAVYAIKDVIKAKLHDSEEDEMNEQEKKQKLVRELFAKN